MGPRLRGCDDRGDARTALNSARGQRHFPLSPSSSMGRGPGWGPAACEMADTPTSSHAPKSSKGMRALCGCCPSPSPSPRTRGEGTRTALDAARGQPPNVIPGFRPGTHGSAGSNEPRDREPSSTPHRHPRAGGDRSKRLTIGSIGTLDGPPPSRG
jgi:hypothetical protein